MMINVQVGLHLPKRHRMIHFCDNHVLHLTLVMISTNRFKFVNALFLLEQGKARMEISAVIHVFLLLIYKLLKLLRVKKP